MHLKNQLSALLFLVILLTFMSCDPIFNSVEPIESDTDHAQHTAAGQSIDNQYIVALKNDDSLLDPILNPAGDILDLINTVIADNEIAENHLLYRYTHSFTGFAAQLTDKQLHTLKEDERVDYIEPDQTMSLIPPLPLPGLNILPGTGNGQSEPYGITRVGGPFNGAGMTAWVIDTGVEINHDDLNVDPERSRSFVLAEPVADDFHGHGTHVAGTIAALDNDIDVVGVVAGATIVGVKVLNALGIGSNSAVIAGIDYVAENAQPGDAANMSLGGGSSEALDDAVRAAADRGILFSIAAGNDGEHASDYSPARVQHKNTWTVSAIDEDDVFASFSNYGNPPVRYAAPGVGIESLWINNSTHTISGTSMAAPHVAGILLASGGNPGTDGTAINDPDNTSDPIVFFND